MLKRGVAKGPPRPAHPQERQDAARGCGTATLVNRAAARFTLRFGGAESKGPCSFLNLYSRLPRKPAAPK